MNRLVLISLLIIPFLHGYPQYLGGSDDGFFQVSSMQAPLNDQEFYCSGGIDDGFSMRHSGILTLNNQELYCSGGSDDGFDRITFSGYLFNPALCYNGGINDGFSILNTGPAYFCNPSVYVSGGINDGFAASSPGLLYICDPSIYSSGGTGDGYHTLDFAGLIYYSPAWLGGISDGFSSLHSPLLALAPTFFCLGGDNDGAHSLHMPSSYFGRGVWLGTASSSWNNPDNWSMNYIPDLTVNVLIAGGHTYYPLIPSGNLTINNPSGSYKCNSLTIQEGGTLFNLSNLYIYGDVTILGLYQADDPDNQDVVINPGGHLKLIAPGVMKIGD